MVVRVVVAAHLLARFIDAATPVDTRQFALLTADRFRRLRPAIVDVIAAATLPTLAADDPAVVEFTGSCASFTLTTGGSALPIATLLTITTAGTTTAIGRRTTDIRFRLTLTVATLFSRLTTLPIALRSIRTTHVGCRKPFRSRTRTINRLTGPIRTALLVRV